MEDGDGDSPSRATQPGVGLRDGSKATQNHAVARHRPRGWEAQAWGRPGDGVLLSCVPLVLLLCSSCVSPPFACCMAPIIGHKPARATGRCPLDSFRTSSSFRCRRVMWLAHSFGAGKRPMKLKLLQSDLLEDHGRLAGGASAACARIGDKMPGETASTPLVTTARTNRPYKTPIFAASLPIGLSPYLSAYFQ